MKSSPPIRRIKGSWQHESGDNYLDLLRCEEGMLTVRIRDNGVNSDAEAPVASTTCQIRLIVGEAQPNQVVIMHVRLDSLKPWAI